MTSEPRAFLALDTGAATIAAALIGRVGARWRLIGSVTMPAGADMEALIAVLGDRMVEADPALAGALELRRGSAVDLPRLEVASHPPRRLAVVAASERALAPLVATAARSGWRTDAASAEADGPAGDVDPAARRERPGRAGRGRAIRRPPTSGAPSASWPRWSRPWPSGGPSSRSSSPAG